MIVATKLVAMTRRLAGSSLLARLAQNDENLIRLVLETSRRRCEVMRNPEMTKKMSTPTYPPLMNCGQRWNITTPSTAIARSA
jgi:hypothetical protein